MNRNKIYEITLKTAIENYVYFCVAPTVSKAKSCSFMEKVKSKKNKTIDFTIENGEQYFNRCIGVKDVKDLSSVLNKTICGDTLKILERLPKKSIDLLVVDPPYNLSKNYNGNKFNKTSSDKYREYTESWIEKCLPLLKNNASIYVCCDWESSMVIGDVLSHYFTILNRITWEREKGRGALTNWKNCHEDIWYCVIDTNNYKFNVNQVKVRRKVIAPYKVDGKPKDWKETKDGNFRDSFPSNFWNDISIPYWSMPENTAHPTQKPEKLIAKLILASSSEGDVVLDPFLGSGTTSVVCKKLKRKYIGIEQNDQYCSWAEYRLEKAEIDSEIQGYVNGVFWERNTLSDQKKSHSKKENEKCTTMNLLDD